jgi:hypothetical protein
LKKNESKKGGWWFKWLEHLPSKCKTLSQTPVLPDILNHSESIAFHDCTIDLIDKFIHTAFFFFLRCFGKKDTVPGKLCGTTDSGCEKRRGCPFKL